MSNMPLQTNDMFAPWSNTEGNSVADIIRAVDVVNACVIFILQVW